MLSSSMATTMLNKWSFPSNVFPMTLNWLTVLLFWNLNKFMSIAQKRP